ncbi:hypothetical protein VTO73DRAFT_10433 [Trametes versicolor]
MCHQQAHSSNKVIDGVPSRGPRRIIGTHNLSLKQLLYMEQSVEDISEIFYRVDCVLGDIDESDTTSTALLRQSWEELQQDFWQIAARCRRNFHDAVAIMDVCTESLLADTDHSSSESANREFKIPEELLRIKAAHGQAASNDLRQLAKKIQDLRVHGHVVPAPSIHPSPASHQLIIRYPQMAQYVLKLLLSFRK